ncbi:MAG: hypothetical protein HY811_04590 [Planctomycetes bacterium]|nr:hypothetical protein [Planctomycetota bacterium]
MKKRLFVFIAISIAALIGISLGNESTDIKIMKLSEIKIGMKGYGKTVFEGTKIEKFDIEVLGVMEDSIGPKLHMILIKCKHPITDKAGIIQGMSGSPIYIVEDAEKEPEGRLIGALAYGWGGWAYGKEPIAGVTPIELMIEDMNRPPEKAGNTEPVYKEEKTAQGEGNTPSKAGYMRPLQTPLFISGMTANKIKLVEKYLAPYNIVPVQTGSASAAVKEMVPMDMEPGSAIGVNVVRGDAEWSGIGTVTYRDGDKFIAFGHQNELKGELAYPISNAYIYGIIPTIESAFKLGSPAKSLGVMTKDEKTGISGFVDGTKTVGMVPVKITVENAKTHNRHEFNYEIVKHRQVMGGVLPTLMSAATEAEPIPESGMIEVITMIKLKGADPISIRRLTIDSPSGAGCGSVNNVFLPIWQNPYKEIEVESVSFEVKVLSENKSGIIQKVWIDQEETIPGETVTINMLIRPYLKPAVLRQMPITIPKDMEPQTINIIISGGNDLMPELPPPTNVHEMIHFMKSYYDSDTIVASIPIKEIDFRVNGKTLPRLPNSIISQLINQTREPVIGTNGINAADPTPSHNNPIFLAPKSLKFIQPSEFVIDGGGSISLKIVKIKTKK